MTYKQKVIRELEASNGHTCADLVTWIKANNKEDENKGRKTLMATISSILHKMWMKDEVYISPYHKGPRGGSVYKLNKEA